MIIQSETLHAISGDAHEMSAVDSFVHVIQVVVTPEYRSQNLVHSRHSITSLPLGYYFLHPNDVLFQLKSPSTRNGNVCRNDKYELSSYRSLVRSVSRGQLGESQKHTTVILPHAAATKLRLLVKERCMRNFSA